jgi:peroxiredoxin
MRKFAVVLFLAVSLLALGQTAAPKAPPKIKVGDTAPDFTLLSFDGKDVKPVSLHDFKGKKNVVLAFYVFAFTGG